MRKVSSINGKSVNSKITVSSDIGYLLTASNGLHVAENDVRLGGTLSADTSISAGTYKLTLDNLYVSGLAGAENQMVIAEPNGLLGTQAIPSGGKITDVGNGLHIDGTIVKLGGTVSESTTINASSMLRLTGDWRYTPNMFVGQVLDGNNDTSYPLTAANSGRIFVVEGGKTVSFNLPDANQPMVFHFIASEKEIFFIGQQNTSAAKIRYIDSTRYYAQISNLNQTNGLVTGRAACSVIAKDGEWQIFNVTGTWYDQGSNPIQ